MQQKYKRTKIFENEEIKSLTETITATTLIKKTMRLESQQSQLKLFVIPYIFIFYNHYVFTGQCDRDKLLLYISTSV